MAMNESIRDLIKPGVSLDALRNAAVASGMIPLKDALREKILSGTISLEEAYRTIMTM